ncbi:HGxxPAAW family protein [Nocardioides houyundeii]|uniref:HGxxPAAW family protein n=1 Tax=Nocardioides houyundeii TaxID=2045452 RepID=UPI000C77EC12|nr:HGxxPAAW family protein [Nocardioides houyundeii]
MADNHGNTPAAWTAVGVAMVGFLVGGIALMLSPVSMVMFWIGIALGVAALPVFLVMSRMGLHHTSSHDSGH